MIIKDGVVLGLWVSYFNNEKYNLNVFFVCWFIVIVMWFIVFEFDYVWIVLKC